MIELNKPYSNKDIAEQLFRVTYGTFRNNKERYLKHLQQYYDFQITDKKKIILKKEIKPFRTCMESRGNLKEEQTEIYREWTHKIIQMKPLNSGSNIARDIDQSPMKPIERHKESTIVNYVRPILKEDFTVISKAWCRINYQTNEYEPLQSDQLKFLYDLFHSKELSENILEITAEYKAGNIGKQEFQARVGNESEKTYDRVMAEFKKKYGFRPIKASNWREKNNGMAVAR